MNKTKTERLVLFDIYVGSSNIEMSFIQKKVKRFVSKKGRNGNFCQNLNYMTKNNPKDLTNVSI